MELEKRFAAEAGQALFLRTDRVERYLKGRKWLEGSEALASLEKPGEGNMNFVLRARVEKRSLIVKQARPWVEKYPQIDAPLDRIRVEAEFYQLIQEDELLSGFTPRRLDWDPDNYILILEDLGEGADFLYVYQKDRRLARKDLMSLLQFISRLHQREFRAEQTRAFPLNQALKQLNHEHIFVYPYLEENGFDLNTVQTGLQELSRPFKTDPILKKRIKELGRVYLGAGPCLIHGDYYPGSWLKVGDGVKVIDPEFGHFGRPEFDLGVMIAHLKMARTAETEIDWTLSAYQAPKGFDEALRRAFTGVEIMRRIIGLAQLPLSLTLPEKQALMEEARNLLLDWEA